MPDQTRWVVLDTSGRPAKGQPKGGFNDYQDAYDFAEERIASGWRIEPQ